MSAAYKDFWTTILHLRELAKELGDATPGTQNSRSINHLRLNGLHVTAFSALEDFLRRRAHEVVSWLGKEGVNFGHLPEKLQRLILQGTIEGLCHSLSRTNEDRVTLLQLQGLLLSNTGDANQPFEPSEFFFGRSASNLQKDDIRQLTEAFGLGEGLACLTVIADNVSMQHLGEVGAVFTRLSKNRHSAAHSFSSDYKCDDFRSDMNSALPVLAFSVDTCISQCAIAIKKAVHSTKLPFQGFSASSSNIRTLEFDQPTAKWIELRNGKASKTLKKGELDRRLKEFSSGTLAKEDTILLRGESGSVEGWIQPLR